MLSKGEFKLNFKLNFLFLTSLAQNYVRCNLSHTDSQEQILNDKIKSLLMSDLDIKVSFPSSVIKDELSPTSLLSTTELLDLRLQKYEQLCLSESIIEKFLKLREKYQGIEYPSPQAPKERIKASISSALSVYQEVWCELATLDTSHCLYIPPIYQSPQIDQVLIDVIHDVRIRESKYDRWPSGHPVIEGVEGTGKTTLVKALAIAVAICSNTYLLAYIDLKQTLKDASYLPTPRLFIAEVCYRLTYQGKLDRRFGCHEVSNAAHTQRHNWTVSDLVNDLHQQHQLDIGIIVDEIQLAFIADVPRDHPNISSLLQYEWYARNCLNALLILTSSAYNVRSLFCNYSRPKAYNMYLNFNRDLTALFTIPAVRTQPDLKSYLLYRYPTITSDYTLRALENEYDFDDYVAEVLYYTGGFGHAVHEYVANRVPITTLGIDHMAYRQELNVFFAILHEYQVTINPDWDTLIGIDAARSMSEVGVVHRLVTPAMVSMSLNLACYKMRSVYNVDDPEALLAVWTDIGVLYIEDNPAELNYPRTVGLARPADAVVCYKHGE